MDVGGMRIVGLYIFTGTHYSMMFTTKDRPQIGETNKATAEEHPAMCGLMAVNAGTYKVSASS